MGKDYNIRRRTNSSSQNQFQIDGLPPKSKSSPKKKAFHAGQYFADNVRVNDEEKGKLNKDGENELQEQLDQKPNYVKWVIVIGLALASGVSQIQNSNLCVGKQLFNISF